MAPPKKYTDQEYKERLAEHARRNSAARGRALQELTKRYPKLYKELYAKHMRDINAERGPL